MQSCLSYHLFYGRNLQWWTNETTLRKILDGCGAIRSVEFEASLKNGKSLGIANIEFETSDAALRAIEFLDNLAVDGKVVNSSLLVVEDVRVTQMGGGLMGTSLPAHYRSAIPIPGRRLMSPRRNRSPRRAPKPSSREIDDHRRREAENRAAEEHRRREAEKRELEEHRREVEMRRESAEIRYDHLHFCDQCSSFEINILCQASE